MSYLSEDVLPLSVREIVVSSESHLLANFVDFGDVCLLRLPTLGEPLSKESLYRIVDPLVSSLGKTATVITLGDTYDLVHINEVLSEHTRYQLWITVKRTTPLSDPLDRALPSHHFGALVHTRYPGSLQHSKTRIAYTYCPACQKTTKDYGGKKHTYNSYGTLMSDVWRDVSFDLSGDLSELYERFADLFGIEQYEELLVADLRDLPFESVWDVQGSMQPSQPSVKLEDSRLLVGDSLGLLRDLPDNSVDFAFADPPYNLGKKYTSYGDDLEIAEYFDWCDKWISELARVLKPGRTCAILNIPLWSIRHFTKMESLLHFQNWIAWDALSFPVRNIMPAHYAIICFTKGQSRSLPGLTQESEPFSLLHAKPYFEPLFPLGEWYCLRARCIRSRALNQVDDRGPLTDLWWDIHRLKHNARRVDHPCQLPPELMYRLITIFTNPNEVVLDCFNGAGTTTLAAHQLGRQYIGIELSQKYSDIAAERHSEISRGVDPFRKMERKLTSKNSPVPRMKKQTYVVPKKVLQLDVRRVAEVLGRLPTREDVMTHGKYDISLYDDYFASWGEATAAARHDGMSESRGETSTAHQPRLL